MTFKDKMDLAHELRSTDTLEMELPDGYEAYPEKTNRKEQWIETSAGETRIYVIRPKELQGESPLYINIHGGGFVRPHLNRDILFTSKIACETGCTAIDVDYKLAPEYPYPAAFYECYDVVKWAFEHAKELQIDPSRVIVGGHSSGGNLTAALALKANETGEFRILLQILDYPPMDLYTDPMDKERDGIMVIPPERARAFNALYVDDRRKAMEPFASPVFATAEQLKGLPDALVITAGEDSLKLEAERYAASMIAAGVKVTAKRFVSSRHGFMAHCLDEYEEGHQLYIDAIKQACQMSAKDSKAL